MSALRTLAAFLLFPAVFLRGAICLAGGGWRTWRPGAEDALWQPPAITMTRTDLAIYGGLAFFGVALIELIYVVATVALSIDPADVPELAGIVALLAVGMGIAIYLIQREV